jgi:hypothetical protein
VEAATAAPPHAVSYLLLAVCATAAQGAALEAEAFVEMPFVFFRLVAFRGSGSAPSEASLVQRKSA